VPFSIECFLRRETIYVFFQNKNWKFDTVKICENRLTVISIEVFKGKYNSELKRNLKVKKLSQTLIENLPRFRIISSWNDFFCSDEKNIMIVSILVDSKFSKKWFQKKTSQQFWHSQHCNLWFKKVLLFTFCSNRKKSLSLKKKFSFSICGKLMSLFGRKRKG